MAKLKAALDADPSIRVVLGTGEADTRAAGLAIERHFKSKGYVAAGFDTGGDILRLVKAGVLQLTVDQQPYAQGFFAVATSPPLIDQSAACHSRHRRHHYPSERY